MGKFIGYGVQLHYSTDAQKISSATLASYSTLAQIRDLKGPAVENSEVEATTLDSTDSYREFLLSLLDPGNVTLDLAWDSTLASHVAITNGLNNRNEHNFKILLANTSDAAASTLSLFFNARVMSFEPTFPVDDLQTASVGLRLTGPVRWPAS